MSYIYMDIIACFFHARGLYSHARGLYSHARDLYSNARGLYSHARTEMMRHRQVWLSKGYKVNIGMLNDADALTLRDWAERFRLNNHPDVALLSDDERQVTRKVRGQDTVLNIVCAWQLFHEKLGSPHVFEIDPTAVSPMGDLVRYVRVRWTGIVTPLEFVDQVQHVHRVPCFPTYPFEGVFRASDLPRGTYSLGELVFMHESLGEENILDAIVFSPVPKETVIKAWNQGRTVLEFRQRRAATPEEIKSFVVLHRTPGICFCMDPLVPPGESVVWRSPEFVSHFGDVKWMPLECDDYDDLIIGILQRRQHLKDVTVYDVNGVLHTYHQYMIYGSETAKHALMFCIWMEGEMPNLLTRYCERELLEDKTFSPIPYPALMFTLSAYGMLYRARGYRQATAEEIQAAAKQVTAQYGSVIDFVRPMDEAYVFMTDLSRNVFGKWPAMEMSDTSWFGTLVTPLSMRIQTLSGEIVCVESHFTFLNNETRLMITNTRIIN